MLTFHNFPPHVAVMSLLSTNKNDVVVFHNHSCMVHPLLARNKRKIRKDRWDHDLRVAYSVHFSCWGRQAMQDFCVEGVSSPPQGFVIVRCSDFCLVSCILPTSKLIKASVFLVVRCKLSSCFGIVTTCNQISHLHISQVRDLRWWGTGSGHLFLFWKCIFEKQRNVTWLPGDGTVGLWECFDASSTQDQTCFWNNSLWNSNLTLCFVILVEQNAQHASIRFLTTSCLDSFEADMLWLRQRVGGQ